MSLLPGASGADEEEFLLVDVSDDSELEAKLILGLFYILSNAVIARVTSSSGNTSVSHDLPEPEPEAEGVKVDSASSDEDASGPPEYRCQYGWKTRHGTKIRAVQDCRGMNGYPCWRTKERHGPSNKWCLVCAWNMQR